MSDYEAVRKANIARNRQMLADLGLLGDTKLPKSISSALLPVSGNQSSPVIKRKRANSKKQHFGITKRKSEPSDQNYIRRSSRISSLPVKSFQEDSADDGSSNSEFSENDEFDSDTASDEEFEYMSVGGKVKSAAKLPPFVPPKDRAQVTSNIIGHVPGIEVGTTWESRLACWYDGVHRAQISGIQGNKTDGCFSIALSGGYEDDVDEGEAFTYTGQGGRELKGTVDNPKNLRTAPQSKDQELKGGNLALKISQEKKIPVRVIRGYKLDSIYAPESGYRYDGLYTVEHYWQDTGKSGFKVYKYAFKRVEGQPEIPKRLNNSFEL